MNLYPLNTFKGETKKELEKMVSKIIAQTREETIRENDLLDLTGKNGDTIYYNDCLTGKKYTWKCIKIEKI